jgi:hypothetical protein
VCFSREPHFRFIQEFSRMYHNDIYPQYDTFIDKEYQEWKADRTNHCIIGSIVRLFVNSKISLTNMIRLKQDVKFIKSSCDTNIYPDDIILRLSINEIHKYKTLKLTKDMRNWSFLNQVACKYVIRRVICNELSITHQENDKINFDKWLYYASYTPIWSKRIQKFNGTICHVFQTVDIDEEFYESYDYEPDEQCKELKNMLWDDNIKKYDSMSISDFCNKYSNDNVYQKIRINGSKKLMENFLVE